LRYLKCIFIGFAVVWSAAAVDPAANRKPAEQALSFIKCQSDSFSLSLHQLKVTITAMNPSKPQAISRVIGALKSCRLEYKKISFFLDYFFPQQGKLFNAPAKKEIEEPFMEYEESQSLQQIEAIVFGPHPEQKKQELENLIMVLDESAAGLESLYAGLLVTDVQIMESMQLELIRIMTLYITGYDAPDLKTGIQESGSALSSMRYMAGLFLQPKNAEAVRLDFLFGQIIRFTRTSDFDHFDRLIFLTQYAVPLEEELTRSMQSYGLEPSTKPHLNENTGNLFQADLNNQDSKPSKALIALGRQLFFEKALSGNNTRTCATCHQPDKYFTDQLVANRKINSNSLLRRNTPTLLYASRQSAQFWDGRVASLRDQIGNVLNSPDEMNAKISEIKRRLMGIPAYHNLFQDSLAPIQSESNNCSQDSLTLIKIETALAAYLSVLQPMNSPFDRFMSGDQQALSSIQKNGFNLFMGKAQCGTCHFAPIFNGSTPPYFNRSEYEVLGVPALTTSQLKIPDTDLGRYELYPVATYKRAFKTPTVRNATKTGPYMHNGCFRTLREVLDFYNQGGGAGIGLASEAQTLSEKKLHLSSAEISDIIAFIGSLTDNLKKAGLN
jgi:cytochrome c peroxidase